MHCGERGRRHHFTLIPPSWFRHGVRPKKMSLPWIARDNFIRGRYDHLGYPVPPPWPSNAKQAREDIRAFFQSGYFSLRALCFDVWRRDRKRFYFYQNFVFEEALNYLQEMGYRYERIVRWVRRPRSR